MTTMNLVVKGIEVDHINGVIRVTKNFLKAAKNPNTPEFALLISTRKECPTYAIVEKTIEKNESKESYGGLSIEKMLAYVHVFKEKDLADFENTIKVYIEANGKVQKGKYATIKKVFLSRFKDDYLKAINDIENVVKIDAKTKELKESTNGIVGKMLSEKSKNNEENKVVDISREQKKVS